MKVSLNKWSVTDQYVTLGLVLDYGGPIRFSTLKLRTDDPEVEMLVDEAVQAIARGKVRESRHLRPVETEPLF